MGLNIQACQEFNSFLAFLILHNSTTRKEINDKHQRIPKQEQFLSWSFGRRNDVSCFGETLIPNSRWVHITNKPGNCDPMEKTDGFSGQNFTKRKIFLTWSLVEWAKPRKRVWIIKIVKNNSVRAFLDYQDFNKTNVSISSH